MSVQVLASMHACIHQLASSREYNCAGVSLIEEMSRPHRVCDITNRLMWGPPMTCIDEHCSSRECRRGLGLPVTLDSMLHAHGHQASSIVRQ